MRAHKPKLVGATTLLAVLFTFFYLLPTGLSANYSASYELLNHPDGSTFHKLNVTISPSLYEYYTGKSHTMNTVNEFAKFVTPYALKPISDSLSEIYSNDEDFANGILMIVHQTTYEETVSPKYPVETIVSGRGDCDLFSFIAASLLKARGFEVVLLYYEQEAHMNIGINLLQEPLDARGESTFVTSGGLRYYVAECTGGNWQQGWRVGECPPELKSAGVQIIALENAERTTTGQVSASYNTLGASSLTFDAPSFCIQGNTATFFGELSPKLSNESITIYIRINNSPWEVLATVLTDSDGHFVYNWGAHASGVCYVRMSWSGNDDYAVADSQIRSLTVLSTFFILLIAVVAILIVAGVFAVLLGRRGQYDISAPLPPEIPT